MAPFSSPSTDSALLRRVQQREPEAWRRFAELYGPMIYAWVRRSGLSPDDAADVTQETFLAVLRGIADFTPAGPGALRGWLWAVTMNKIRDHLRRHSNKQRAVGGTNVQLMLQQLPQTPPDPESNALAREDLRGVLQRGLAQIQDDFSPQTWLAFQRCVIEGRESSVVAAELGVSMNNLRQIRFRIVRRLREHLRDFL